MSVAPDDDVSVEEAAWILGASPWSVLKLITSGLLSPVTREEHPRLTRSDVETLALQSYRWSKHLHDVDPYWVSTRGAADILRVNPKRLNRLATWWFLPYETTARGVRLYRRQQVEEVARARDVRFASRTEPLRPNGRVPAQAGVADLDRGQSPSRTRTWRARAVESLPAPRDGGPVGASRLAPRSSDQTA